MNELLRREEQKVVSTPGRKRRNTAEGHRGQKSGEAGLWMETFQSRRELQGGALAVPYAWNTFSEMSTPLSFQMSPSQ